MKKFLLLVLLAAAGAGGWYLWQQQQTAAHDDGTRVYYGNVDVRQVSLAFDGQGRVTALHAEEGDRVRAGERLGELDTRTLALQAAQAEAQIEVQQETLRRLRNGARPQEIAQAKSRVTAAETEATQAQKDLNRVQGVFDKTQGGAISAQDVERARSAVQVARARVAEQREGAVSLLGAVGEPRKAALHAVPVAVGEEHAHALDLHLDLPGVPGKEVAVARDEQHPAAEALRQPPGVRDHVAQMEHVVITPRLYKGSDELEHARRVVGIR